MGLLHTYDFAQVSVTLAGIPIGGYGEAGGVQVARNEDSFKLHVGADGEGTRAKSNNRSGKVTVTLAQSSLANDALSALVALDELSPGGDAIGPLLVKDNSGRTICSAAHCWVTKPADAEYKRETAEREWVIETDQLTMFIGGN